MAHRTYSYCIDSSFMVLCNQNKKIFLEVKIHRLQMSRSKGLGGSFYDFVLIFSEYSLTRHRKRYNPLALYHSSY